MTSVFLQGDPLEPDKYRIPVRKLDEALGIPPGMPARVCKGVYGLLKGPGLWVNHDGSFSTLLGFLGISLNCLYCLTWLLYEWQQKERHGGPKLVGLLAFYKDDFLITGVDFRQLPNGFVHLDQMAYLKDVEVISLSLAHRRERGSAVTEKERSELRGVLAALLWPATQSCPRLCTEVSCLQSCVSTATVETLLRAN